MRTIRLAMILLLALSATMFVAPTAFADEPVTLIGTIVKWRYPEADIGKSEMSDAATIDAQKNRTVPSSLLKTTMTTPASVEKVVAFYRDLLTRNSTNDEKLGIGPDVGRSVVFSDDSEGHSLSLHTIVVNSANSSTTLIITRAQGDEKTRITWKQYLRHEVGK